MNFIRRLYLTLLSVILIAVVSLFLLFPQTVNSWSASVSEQTPLLRILAAGVADVLLLAVLYLQARPDPRARATGLMMNASGAITEVSVESARTRILKAVNDVPDVVSADAEVKPIRGRADVELQVTVMGHDVQLPAKQKEINRALNQVIHKQLGLQMAGQPRVHIRFHGEDVVKPSVPPVVLQPEKPPVEAVIPIKSTPVEPAREPEPQKTLGIFHIHKESEIKADEPEMPEIPLAKTAEEPVKAELPKVETIQPADNEFVLNLEKEIASSATEDILVDEDEPVKPSADEVTLKPETANNPEKEANFDNNRI